MTTTELQARADWLRAQRTPFVLATVVRAERPTSAKAGDRAIVLADGTIEGFVGGACAESTVRLEGLRLLDSGEATLLRITPIDQDPVETGERAQDLLGPADPPATQGLRVVANPCLSGGTLDIFLEPVRPAPLLHIFGDAPIARALATLASAAGYAVSSSTDPQQPPGPDMAAVVVASHGRDEPAVLTAALRAGVAYVGLVASRRRGEAVVSGLDVPDELRARVRTPAGLDLGARTPVDVAVSIVAELVAVRSRARPAPVQPAAPQPVAPGSATSSSAVSVSAPVPAAVPAEPAPVATDPVCGMSVAAVPASLHLEHAGTTWYFCGPGCRQAFADEPGRYGA